MLIADQIKYRYIMKFGESIDKTIAESSLRTKDYASMRMIYNFMRFNEWR